MDTICMNTILVMFTIAFIGNALFVIVSGMLSMLIDQGSEFTSVKLQEYPHQETAMVFWNDVLVQLNEEEELEKALTSARKARKEAMELLARIQERHTPIPCPPSKEDEALALANNNTFEAQVLMVFGFYSIPERLWQEDVTLDNDVTYYEKNTEALFPEVAAWAQPEIAAPEVSNVLVIQTKSVTENGYWLDQNGRVRDNKGRFAKLPKGARRAA